VSVATPPEVSENEEILHFLHRFADLMASGNNNSENLLRAARVLETNAEMVKQTSELLRVERVRGDANAELRKALEDRIAGLENRIVTLQTQLSESQAKLNEQNLEAETKQGELLRRVEEAEAKLSLAEQAFATKTSDDTHILVPVTTLRLARAQFESLASSFEKAGNIISQTMCEASASSLDRAIIDGGAPESDNRSKHAA
jgi:DNA repair exonuclease SbcCD ATPase subunit